MSEQEPIDDEKKNEELADLELDADQADQTKAGRSASGAGQGKVAMNDYYFVNK